jgi:hypothetical protein
MSIRFRRMLSVTVLAILMSGCASAGMFPSAHLTEVQLSAGNFQVVATNVGGEAQAEYILGASVAVFTEMRTFALARISGTGMLYQEALEALWADFSRRHGPVEGRRLALVNVRFDSDALNLLLFTRARISVRADVVEFVP